MFEVDWWFLCISPSLSLHLWSSFPFLHLTLVHITFYIHPHTHKHTRNCCTWFKPFPPKSETLHDEIHFSSIFKKEKTIQLIFILRKTTARASLGRIAVIVIQCTNIFALPRLPCAFSFIFGPRDKEKIMDSWLHHTTNFQNRLLNIYLSSLFPLLPSTVFFFAPPGGLWLNLILVCSQTATVFIGFDVALPGDLFDTASRWFLQFFFPFPELVTIFFFFESIRFESEIVIQYNR